MLESIFGKVPDYFEEQKRIIRAVKKLRQKKLGKKTDWRKAAEWHIKYSNLNGIPSLALTITLSPTGCEWARKGGCTMCGEFEGSYKRDDLLKDPKFHISQFVSAINNPRVWNVAKKENKPISWLRIYQEGNYTNSQEMDITAQKSILHLATHIKDVKRVTIESRPQYLTNENISFLNRIFEGSNVELEIGMGLEAQDDVVRNICINKQETKTQFINTIGLLNKYGIKSLAYIIIKPPFLTEQEAIVEAIKTAHFATEIGFNRISLEPMSIHKYSLIDLLHEAGYYNAPWLWSVIEVAKGCSDISKKVGIGGVGYYPIPTEYSHNYCHDNKQLCNKIINEKINEYNRYRESSIFDKIECPCKKSWEDECKQSVEPLKNRINMQMDKIDQIIETYSPKETIPLDKEMTRNSRILDGEIQEGEPIDEGEFLGKE